MRSRVTPSTIEGSQQLVKPKNQCTGSGRLNERKGDPFTKHSTMKDALGTYNFPSDEDDLNESRKTSGYEAPQVSAMPGDQEVFSPDATES
jgi:hypothetical protein